MRSAKSDLSRQSAFKDAPFRCDSVFLRTYGDNRHGHFFDRILPCVRGKAIRLPVGLGVPGDHRMCVPQHAGVELDDVLEPIRQSIHGWSDSVHGYTVQLLG